MKKYVFAFALSASLALNILLPVASSASSSVDQLNARMRQEIRETGKLPDPSTLPQPRLPDMELHVFYLVDTNKRGQVVKVRAGHPSKSDSFNTYTYFNALQTFIRRVDGSATAGIFRLSYDYAPATKLIKRDVTLVQKGGVNIDAPGAVEVMERQAAASSKSKK